jgi:hypothetical protein
MRMEVPTGTRTYPLALSLRAQSVDLWTLCGVTNSLQDGRLAGVRSSNNEDSEFDVATVLGVPRRFRRGLTHSLIAMLLQEGDL